MLRSIDVFACQNVVAVSHDNLFAVTTPTVAGGDVNAAGQVEGRVTSANHRQPMLTMSADVELTSEDDTSTVLGDNMSVDVVNHHSVTVDTRDTIADVDDGTHHQVAVVQRALAGRRW